MNFAHPIIYGIDDKDRIYYVNDEWVRFARANQWLIHNFKDILGSNFWEFISDNNVAQLYRDIVQKVRNTRKSIQLYYRCDSPVKKRFHKMTILAAKNYQIEFINETLAEIPVRFNPLLDVYAERNENILHVCSWCKAVYVDHDWVEIEEAVNRLGIFNHQAGGTPRISHGMCEACFDQVNAEIAETFV